MRGRRTALVLAALFSCHATVAQATELCDDLRARLSAAYAQPDSTEVRRYSSAITKQNFEIRKARQDMQRMQCGQGSIITYGSDGRDPCRELSNAIRRMEDNRQILTEKRLSLEEASVDPSISAHLLAALETNGCNAEEQIDEVRTPRPVEGPRLPRALVRVPGIDQGPALGEQAGINQSFASPDALMPRGPLRTMCVSTCDGSFFPISSNASPVNFARDAQQCNQMCPGAPTELFYHSLLTQESADMVSAETGTPYRSLPNAFAYLSRSPGAKSACSCNLADYHRRAMQAQNPAPVSTESYSSITTIRGTQGPQSVAPAQPPTEERSYDPAAASVRSVGPTFLQSEASQIDLRNPKTPGPQPIQQ